MLRIRLKRVGKRGKPSYRIVVAEAKAPRDGAYLDWIGTYDPMKDPPAFTLKTDRANDWLGKGAQPSDAVKRILDWNELLGSESAPSETTSDETPSGESVSDEPVSLEQTDAAPDTSGSESNEDTQD